MGNLGVLVKPGIILPSDRHESICLEANDGYPGLFDVSSLLNTYFTVGAYN